MKRGHSAVSWGATGSGGDSSSVASQLAGGVSFVAHTDSAFAVVKRDGAVVAWGDSLDLSSVSDLVNVISVHANRRAFIAVTGEGAAISEYELSIE